MNMGVPELPSSRYSPPAQTEYERLRNAYRARVSSADIISSVGITFSGTLSAALDRPNPYERKTITAFHSVNEMEEYKLGLELFQTGNPEGTVEIFNQEWRKPVVVKHSHTGRYIFAITFVLLIIFILGSVL